MNSILNIAILNNNRGFYISLQTPDISRDINFFMHNWANKC